jgi:hypothetical protein
VPSDNEGSREIFSYSCSLDIFDKDTGTLVESISLGQSTFQQWSAPILAGVDSVIIGRVDGAVSVVDLREMRVIEAISLVERGTKRLEVGDSSLPSFR